LPEEYFEGLTAEVYDQEKNRWRKLPGRKNEALDTFVGAYAAALHPSIRINMIKDYEWAKLESNIEPLIKDLFTEAAPIVAVAAEIMQPKKVEQLGKPVAFKRKNFSTDWRNG
jgi:phage terminase large subunit GpA-like protein